MLDVLTLSLKQTSPMTTFAQISNLLSARTRLSNSLAKSTCCKDNTQLYSAMTYAGWYMYLIIDCACRLKYIR